MPFIPQPAKNRAASVTRFALEKATNLLRWNQGDPDEFVKKIAENLAQYNFGKINA
jgi:hypothetical protein